MAAIYMPKREASEETKVLVNEYTIPFLVGWCRSHWPAPPAQRCPSFCPPLSTTPRRKVTWVKLSSRVSHPQIDSASCIFTPLLHMHRLSPNILCLFWLYFVFTCSVLSSFVYCLESPIRRGLLPLRPCLKAFVSNDKLLSVLQE